MILKGSKRGGAMQLAKHLLNAEQNEHVRVYDVSGFTCETVSGALNEIYAISLGTQCRQFMFSLSLNPPEQEDVPASIFEDALRRAEQKLGLEGQPRIVVFHEKEGRRHAHAVWSRIDADKMIAIDQPFFKNRLNEISKAIFLEQEWRLPDGYRDKTRKNPLNFTREEWQQALRIARSPRDIKRELQEAWAVSDNRKSFERALSDIGYTLSKGDRRNIHVALDLYGEVYPLYRALGKKQKEVAERLGKADKLSTAKDTKITIARSLKPKFDHYIKELRSEQLKAATPLLHQKQSMTKRHKAQRATLETEHEKRWQNEEHKRSARVQRGFKGLWDKLTGKYWKLRKTNERETLACYKRDQKEREKLIQKQLSQRQALQDEIKNMRTKHEKDRQDLIRDLVEINSYEHIEGKEQLKQQWLNELEFESNFDNDIDPEL